MLSKQFANMLSDDEIASLTLAAYINEKYPDSMRKLFQKHDYNFSGDPNINLIRLAELIDNKKSFFTGDYEQVLTTDAGMQAGKLRDVINNIGAGIKNVISSPAAQTILPMVANIAGAAGFGIPGQGNILAGLMDNAFGSGEQPPAPGGTPLAPQQAIQQIAQQTKDGTIMQTGKEKEDEAPDDGTLLGMPKKTAYWVIGIGSGVIVLVASIMIYNHYKKKKKKPAA